MQFINIIIAAIATTVAAQNPTTLYTVPAPVQTGNSTACTGGDYQCSKTSNGTATVQVCNDGNWVTSSYCQQGWQCHMDDAQGATCSN